jgi:hypothetical protein
VLAILTELGNQIGAYGVNEMDMCPWAISINVLVIRCATQITLIQMC